MTQNLDLKFQIKDLRESGISFFQEKVRFGVKTLIWALVWNGPEVNSFSILGTPIDFELLEYNIHIHWECTSLVNMNNI